MSQALDRADVEYDKPPRHFAMICDGHRRFAIEHGLSMVEGYKAGLEVVFKMIPCIFVEHEVEIFSISWMGYAITVDPSPRARRRSQAVWDAMFAYFDSEQAKVFHEHQICFKILGEKDTLPPDLLKVLEPLEIATQNYHPRKFYIALGYSHFREVISASLKFSGKMGDILEFSQNLWVQEPVDLLFRPGGVYVRGDFLLLQSIHARIFFADTLLPEITKNDIDKLFKAYMAHNVEHKRTTVITREVFS